LTQKHVWEYMKWRVDDSEAEHAAAYAREIFCTENGIPKEQEHLVNEEMFSYFEADLEQRGQEMVSKPRNQQFPTKLPGKFALLAAAYGTGKDDYLATVLGIDVDAGKLATWTANFDFGPMADDCVPCGSGHYFDYRDSENDLAAQEAWHREKGAGFLEDVNGAVPRARRDKTFERAWSDFFVRATPLLRNSVHWVEAKS
jgi:hypothetical protein